MKKPHQIDLRKGRFSQPNRIYHVTTTTINRTPIFTDLKSARALIRILHSIPPAHANTLACVVMPDHLLWLVQLGEQQSLSKLVQSVKSISAHEIGQPIWQQGFYDHALRKDEDIQSVARYIIANPLRAGLVQHIGDYPHWDAVWL